MSYTLNKDQDPCAWGPLCRP